VKLGARHRPQPLAVRPLSRRASLHLMIPPPHVDWHAKCPADGDALSNDKYGCCVEVADSRIIQMRKATANRRQVGTSRRRAFIVMAGAGRPSRNRVSTYLRFAVTCGATRPSRWYPTSLPAIPR
jgi:hypothetical protein